MELGPGKVDTGRFQHPLGPRPAPHPQQSWVGPTLRYWYRQIDIQLDSILSTTVSDLKVQKGFVQGTR